MRRVAQAKLTLTAASTTYKLGVFIAPCACKVTKISVNAVPFPDYATSTLDVAKAVIGGTDLALCTQVNIDGATTDTEIEATLTTANLNAGEAITVQVEYMPTEQ